MCINYLHLKLLDGSRDPEIIDELDDILNKMSNLNLKDEAKSPSKKVINGCTTVDLSSYKNDKDFRMDAASIKLNNVLKEIKNVISSKKGDKWLVMFFGSLIFLLMYNLLYSVVVSQWTTLLKVMGVHLVKEGIAFDVIQGTVKLEERDRIMKNFNFNAKGPEV